MLRVPAGFLIMTRGENSFPRNEYCRLLRLDENEGDAVIIGSSDTRNNEHLECYGAMKYNGRFSSITVTGCLGDPLWKLNEIID